MDTDTDQDTDRDPNTDTYMDTDTGQDTDTGMRKCFRGVLRQGKRQSLVPLKDARSICVVINGEQDLRVSTLRNKSLERSVVRGEISIIYAKIRLSYRK